MTQQGHIFRKGGSWYLRYRDTLMENGELVRRQICKKVSIVDPEHQRRKIPPQSVIDMAAELMKPLAKSNPQSTQVLAAFVREVYFPWAETQKRASTLATDKNRWVKHLEARCGGIRLREFRTVTGQELIEAIARQNDLSRTTLHQFKSFLSAVFTRAKQLGLLDGVNPIQGVSIPKNVRGKSETFAMSLDEIKAMLAILPEPSRTVVAVAGYAGLRRGEIQGLQWPDYDGKQLNVSRSVWEGIESDPKSDSSKSAVPVISTLAKILDLYRLSRGNPASGSVFQSSGKSKKPLRLNNLLRSQIMPALNRCGVCFKSKEEHNADVPHEYSRDESIPVWRGWHSFRRGLATNLHDLGVDDKTIQAILRHSNVAVTQQAYIKTLPKQTVDAMDRLNAKVESTQVQ